MNFPDAYLNQFIRGDCIKLMRELPSESIDLVVNAMCKFI